MRKLKQCTLYRDWEDAGLLFRVCQLMESCGESPEIAPLKVQEFYECLHDLVESVSSYGLSGNLWQNYVSLQLVRQENAFSRACEIRGDVGGSLSLLARQDFAIIQEIFFYPFSSLGERIQAGLGETLEHFEPATTGGRMLNLRIRDRISNLSLLLAGSSDTAEFMGHVTDFYRDYGVGSLGLHKAFRLDHGEDGRMIILPIKQTASVQLEDLVGYELAKQKLIENTEAFVSGRRANNCLLFGDAGTGKSSSIKGILNRYYGRGLRIIEVYKHQFQDLSALIAQIKDRNYRFIIYMDDLSFEDFEIEYKYLKAVIEGGLEERPQNILIYATSNRRHLIREKASDKLELEDENDLHSSDTVQEKLSLAYRFGVRIYFGSPSKKEFQNIVRTLAARNGLTMSEEELFALANKWELSHGGMTGRTAQQFIDYLLGTGSDIEGGF